MLKNPPKILMVYPDSPATFWSFKNALRFVSKKSAEPPLGLITIGAMLPESWQLRLADMNVKPLMDKEIQWADYVFISGMDINRSSFKIVIQRCNEHNKPVVAGGPMITSDHSEFVGIDCFVIGEAEELMDEFVKDLINGCLKPMYKATDYPNITTSPVPRWDLLDINKYATISIQYSRGCPYDCEFCSITFLNGRNPRTKSSEQFIGELESLYQIGWRGSVFIVDDNFIGNKRKLKEDLLPRMGEWCKLHKYPFKFMTESSINLAEDDLLIEGMVNAGFDAVFLGIETPEEESLKACGKNQNIKLNMVEAVDKLHNSGIMVTGGFIVGFDQDGGDIFDRQIQFIKNSKIVTAMVGLLNAPTGTKLFQRLKKENRLIKGMSGDNMDGSINFIPKMEYKTLLQGYQKILETIYSPEVYYGRVKSFLKAYKMPIRNLRRMGWSQLAALFRSFWILGVKERSRKHYWELLIFTLFKHPKKLALSVTLAIYGYHFRQVVKSTI